ncbi:MAG: hypothetical protein ACI378_00715 [Bacteroides sp.]
MGYEKNITGVDTALRASLYNAAAVAVSEWMQRSNRILTLTVGDSE